MMTMVSLLQNLNQLFKIHPSITIVTSNLIQDDSKNPKSDFQTGASHQDDDIGSQDENYEEEFEEEIEEIIEEIDDEE